MKKGETYMHGSIKVIMVNADYSGDLPVENCIVPEGGAAGFVL